MNTDALASFIAALEGADSQDDATFQALLAQGIESLQLVDKDIAHAFTVSRPTVTRWRNGESAPHPALRKPVFDWLERRARTMNRRSSSVSSGSGAYVAAPLARAARGGR